VPPVAELAGKSCPRTVKIEIAPAPARLYIWPIPNKLS
jgi:hypothetical protein